MSHDAEVGGSGVQTPEVFLAVARVREEALVGTLEVCG